MAQPRVADVIALYPNCSWWRQFYIRFRVTLSHLEQIEPLLPSTGRVLDLGCGYGVIANYLALSAPARQVIGLDLNPQRIAIAQQTINGRQNITFLVGNVMQADLPPCDGVILTDVLHHLAFDQQEQLLRRLYDLLVPEGMVLIQEVNMRPRWKYWMSYLSDLILYAKDALPNFRSELDWLTLLERQQFRGLQVLRGDTKSIFARVSYLGFK